MVNYLVHKVKPEQEIPTPLEIVEERSVGAGLGADSIAAGKIAAFIGMLLVCIFMILIYGAFGALANVSLIVNLFIIISLLGTIGATLTLPGIAGIVLTIGMAVDADDRLSNYQTSSPFRDYHIEAKQYTTDKKKLEEIAHKEAAKLGVQLGEWFKINKLQAISLIKSLKLST